MANISNIIEKFILDTLKQDASMDISRNELASFFNVSPSQINYVLSTRFTTDRGFEVVSHRGGNGFIRLIRLNISNSDEFLLKLIQEKLKNPIDYNSAKNIVLNLLENDIIKQNECNVILDAISPKALASPINLEDNLRSQILKNILLGIIRK